MNEEVRIDVTDGTSYPHRSFVEFYGPAEGNRRWKFATRIEGTGHPSPEFTSKRCMVLGLIVVAVVFSTGWVVENVWSRNGEANRFKTERISYAVRSLEGRKVRANDGRVQPNTDVNGGSRTAHSSSARSIEECPGFIKLGGKKKAGKTFNVFITIALVLRAAHARDLCVLLDKEYYSGFYLYWINDAEYVFTPVRTVYYSLTSGAFPMNKV